MQHFFSIIIAYGEDNEKLEAQRLQLEHWEKEEREREYDQREAKYQCDRCTKKHNCEYSSKGLINCAAFVPKRI